MIAHMDDAVRDGEVKHPMVHRLARVTADPARGLMSLMDECGFGAAISSVPGPLVSDMCLPSSILNLLHDHFPNKLPELLGCADEELLAGFWEQLLPKHPELRASPWFRNTSSSDWGRIVPCTIHEDAGPYTKKLSANVLSWGGDCSAEVEKRHLSTSSPPT